MPVYLQKQFGEDTFLAVWNISEHKDELLQLIDEHIYDKHSDSRKDNLHWLASRALIRHLFKGHVIEVIKDEFNKPSLTVDGNPYFISITHSYQYAAVIVSKTRAVGIDMEKMDERIQRVKHKFTRDDEFFFLQQEKESEMLTVIWSAKETLYKYYGKKELDFKLHLKIEPFSYLQSLFELIGIIEKEDLYERLPITVEAINGYVLTFIY
jgi:4'-phosphopantetheinyl transferase